ncbi:MAG TPA: hypothetical protein VFK38_00465 [Candidatus Limnocylindrales bacterium]|nr:hypothetical protein [Candidatus Limnocylindrales bacterium]
MAAVARQGLVEIRIASPRVTWRMEEAIVVEASLVYLGQAPVVASGSGSGLVGFSVVQQGGPLRMEAGGTSDCVRYQLRPGPQAVAFSKSGGFSGDDPNAAFYRAFFADPDLHLPPGRWRITAHVDLVLGQECGGEPTDPSASIEIVVRP